MRLEVFCEDRLGLTRELLDLLVSRSIDLRGIEIDPIGRIYLNFSQLDFDTFRALMAEIREQMGDAPVYLSFDIDGLDPAFAPGTGTPEVGGLSVWQGLEIVRGCHGLNLVGGDVVEVSPPYDRSGNTALLAANLLFEMLCVLPAR